MRARPVEPGDHFARRHAPGRVFVVERIDRYDTVPHARLKALASSDRLTIAVAAMEASGWVRVAHDDKAA